MAFHDAPQIDGVHTALIPEENSPHLAYDSSLFETFCQCNVLEIRYVKHLKRKVLVLLD
jgi:hypothetical protein